jgi:hypothetical protein
MASIFALVLGLSILVAPECQASNELQENTQASQQAEATDVDDLLLADLESISAMTVTLSSKK